MTRRLLFALVALVATVGLVASQDASPSPALLAQIDELEQWTTEIRGLQASTPVDRRFPGRGEVEAFIAGQLDNPELQDYYREAQIAYVAFDLLPADLDLVGSLQTLLVAQVGGYYDTDTKAMNTLLITGGELTDRLPLLEQIVYVHEFTHALQDQNFDLAQLFGGEDDIAFSTQYPDQALAVQALVEGDATEVMTVFTQLLTEERPAEVLQDLSALTGMMGSLDIPAGTPPILEAELTFPYLTGQKFVQALVAAGGWALVDEAFRNPPRSSEQIIDPDAYLSGDEPIAVDLLDVSSILGEGWTQRFDRTGGEFFLRRYLNTQLSSIAVTRAAGGWGGDRYRLYTDDDARFAWVWKLTWDTTNDAEQFASAIDTFMTARFGAEPSDGCWSGSDGAACVVQNGPGGDTVITRAPTLELAVALREATGF
ncbi:MAG: hypothetical protein IPM16_17710 [Chloroflexi bacterium]|nr:hypothetical protein [Chloroflexota bacterium]